MVLEIGSPFQWSSIAALIATHYPEYTVQFDPTGTPLRLAFETGLYSTPFFFDMTVFHHVALAMVCPPHTSVRPMSISFGGNDYDLFSEGFRSSSPSAYAVSAALIAPNAWQEFLSSTDFATADAAQTDVRAQEVAYQAAHPTFKFLGIFESIYKFTDMSGEHFVVASRVAFRDM